MSHALHFVENSNYNFRFNFMNKIFKQKIPETEGDNFYDDSIKLFNILEFNIRGLNENIYYLLLLIKKKKINISIDIYEANILPILIHNYNFQFINEFCLLKQIIDNPNKIHRDMNDYYKEGINFMIEKYQMINYSHEFYEVKKYNEESTIELDGNDFDSIYYPNEQLIKNELYFNSSEICFNNETYYTYKIDKICNKIIKTTNDCGQKKQIKKNDIKNITIKKYRCKKFPSPPYFNDKFRNYLRFSNREINDKLFEEFTKNKNNIMNVYRLLKYVSAEVNGIQTYRVKHFHTEISHLYKLDELDDVNS